MLFRNRFPIWLAVGVTSFAATSVFIWVEGRSQWDSRSREGASIQRVPANVPDEQGEVAVELEPRARVLGSEEIAIFETDRVETEGDWPPADMPVGTIGVADELPQDFLFKVEAAAEHSPPARAFLADRRELLSGRIDDWSANMEGRLRTLLQTIPETSTFRTSVTCRSSLCEVQFRSSLASTSAPADTQRQFAMLTPRLLSEAWLQQEAVVSSGQIGSAEGLDGIVVMIFKRR